MMEGMDKYRAIPVNVLVVTFYCFPHVSYHIGVSQLLQDALAKSPAGKSLQRFAWSQPVVPLVQRYGGNGGGLYVEYLLVAYGPDYTGNRLVLGRALSDQLLAYPSPEFRLPRCKEAADQCEAVAKLDLFMSACASDVPKKQKGKKSGSGAAVDTLLANMSAKREEEDQDASDKSEDHEQSEATAPLGFCDGGSSSVR